MITATFFLLSKREIQGYKKEISLWQEMEFLASYFVNELRFTCDEPLKILKRYALQKEVELQEVFSLEKAVVLLLGEEDIGNSEEVVMFIGGLGTTDLEGQLAHCSRFARLFGQKAQRAQALYQTQGKLRQKLWILAGVCAFLLLI